MTQLSKPSYVDDQLLHLRDLDKRIGWKQLVERGLTSTKEKLEKPVQTPKKSKKYKGIAMLVIALLWAAVVAYGCYALNGDSFAQYKDAIGAFDNAKMSHNMALFIRSLQVLTLAGFAGSPAFFLIGNSRLYDYSMDARLYKSNKPTGLEVPHAVTYTAQVHEEGKQNQARVDIYRSAPHENIFDRELSFYTRLSEDPVEAVEELDALMLKLRDLQEQSYVEYKQVLQSEGIATKALQQERFEQMKADIERAARMASNKKTYIKTLSEHAAHHNKVSQEMFIEDPLADIANQTSALTQAAAATTPMTREAA